MDRTIKMFADVARLEQISELATNPLVSGFTTNPTLMRRAGVLDYRSFAMEAVSIAYPRPISFEVFSDDLDEMIVQAEEIASWGENVYVKIPISNSRGLTTSEVIHDLALKGIRTNVTAILLEAQVEMVARVLVSSTPSVISVFAGRIADTGVDPVPVMRKCRDVLRSQPLAELLWASPRELLNLVQAEQCGCDIITMTPELWSKLPLLGKDLEALSLETVTMFHDDAKSAGYSL